MRKIIAFLLVIFSVRACFGWSEEGHHIIGVMAFELLTEAQQTELIEALKSHPRFNEDFNLAIKGDVERALIGAACYWPDTARSQPKYNRPDWHWQLGSSLVIGNPPNVPKNPGPCPADANLDSKDLHIAQAIELCRGIWQDKKKPTEVRALALCWLGHLVGDSHQPCHSGSLYTEKLFPEGDRGANSIPTKQSRNMRSLWDGLLGLRFDEGDIRRRSLEIKSAAERRKFEKMLDQTWEPRVDKLDTMEWLAQSSVLARKFVYAAEVLEKIKAADADGSKLEPIELSEEYLKDAGLVAQLQAWQASHRLAKIWAEGLDK